MLRPCFFNTLLGLKIAETLQEAQLIAPELLNVEVLSVLRGALLAKKLSEERARFALEDL